MVTLRRAAEQALAAIKSANQVNYSWACVEAVAALEAALAEPEQEPVAWMWRDGTVTSDPDRADGTWTPLYTAPPQRKPLTEEEIRAIRDTYYRRMGPIEFARAIEAAHGIKVDA